MFGLAHQHSLVDSTISIQVKSYHEQTCPRVDSTEQERTQDRQNKALQSKQVDRIQIFHVRIAGLQALNKNSEAGIWFLGGELSSKISSLSCMVYKKMI